MAECAVEVGRLGQLGGSRNASVLSVVQSIWPLIERGRTAEAMAVMREAFGEMPELAGDGGSLVRLYLGQDPPIRAAALPLLPQMLANLAVDKEWLPNLAAVVEGLWEDGIGGEPARLLYNTLLPWSHLFIVDGIGAAMAGSVHRSLGELATLLRGVRRSVGPLRQGDRGQQRDRGTTRRRERATYVRDDARAPGRPRR